MVLAGEPLEDSCARSDAQQASKGSNPADIDEDELANFATSQVLTEMCPGKSGCSAERYICE